MGGAFVVPGESQLRHPSRSDRAGSEYRARSAHASAIVASDTGVGASRLAKLSRLASRGRALEILLVGDGVNGPRAELHGYVNQVTDDDNAMTRSN